MPDLPPKLEKEAATLSAMVDLYCKAHHEAPHPCGECASLMRYARGRLAACPYGEEKPVCSKCPIHCYGRVMRERVRGVMGYAGPRMMLHHPVTAVRHLVREKMPRQGDVAYVPDAGVHAAMDRKIRDLLTTCFTGPQDIVFRTQRYVAEPVPHRWVIMDGERLVAQVGVHEKQMETGGEVISIGGVAEVCVHPDYRGQGRAKRMLQSVHAWLTIRGFVFSVLFGDPKIYESSGYKVRRNVSCDIDGQRTAVDVMVLELAGRPWPEGDVHLPGPKF